MTNGRPVLDEAIAAARAGDLDTLRRLIDWPLSGAGTVSRGLSIILEPDRARVVASGLAELEAAATSPETVHDLLQEEAVPQLAQAQEVREAPADTTESVLAALQVPSELPPGLTEEQLAQLAELRRRTARLQQVYLVAGHAGEWPVAFASDSGRLVLVLSD